MIITFEGQDYDFDADRISVDEWRELKRKYKMSPKGFQDGIAEADPDAMTFLYVAMQRQAGNTRITLGDHVKVDILALQNAVGTAQEAEEAEAAGQADEAEADPTKASPSPAPSPGPSQPPASQSSEGSPPITG